jgi:hypothetical protein
MGGVVSFPFIIPLVAFPDIILPPVWFPGIIVIAVADWVVSFTANPTPSAKMAAVIIVAATAKFRDLFIIHRNEIIHIKIVPNYFQICHRRSFSLEKWRVSKTRERIGKYIIV